MRTDSEQAFSTISLKQSSTKALKKLIMSQIRNKKSKKYKWEPETNKERKADRKWHVWRHYTDTHGLLPGSPSSTLLWHLIQGPHASTLRGPLGIQPQLIYIQLHTIKHAHTKTHTQWTDNTLFRKPISISKRAPVCTLRLVVPILTVD